MSSVTIAQALGMTPVEFDLGGIPADAVRGWGGDKPMLGKTHTEETKQAMSAIRKGRSAHRGHYKIAAQLRERNKGPYSDETRARMSASAKARCARQKAAKEALSGN